MKKRQVGGHVGRTRARRSLTDKIDACSAPRTSGDGCGRLCNSRPPPLMLGLTVGRVNSAVWRLSDLPVARGLPLPHSVSYLLVRSMLGHVV